jgi:hypothetical protein
MQVGDAAFDDLMRYLAASETEIDETSDDPQTAASSQNDPSPKKRRVVDEESDEFACSWKECVWRGPNIHALSTHLDVAHLSRATGRHQWLCLWRSCGRTEPFSRRWVNFVRYVG